MCNLRTSISILHEGIEFVCIAIAVFLVYITRCFGVTTYDSSWFGDNGCSIGSSCLIKDEEIIEQCHIISKGIGNVETTIRATFKATNNGIFGCPHIGTRTICTIRYTRTDVDISVGQCFTNTRYFYRSQHFLFFTRSRIVGNGNRGIIDSTTSIEIYLKCHFLQSILSACNSNRWLLGRRSLFECKISIVGRNNHTACKVDSCYSKVFGSIVISYVFYRQFSWIHKRAFLTDDHQVRDSHSFGVETTVCHSNISGSRFHRLLDRSCRRFWCSRSCCPIDTICTFFDNPFCIGIRIMVKADITWCAIVVEYHERLSIGNRIIHIDSACFLIPGGSVGLGCYIMVSLRRHIRSQNNWQLLWIEECLYWYHLCAN